MDDLLLRRWTVLDAPALLRLSRTSTDLDRQLPVLDDLEDCRTMIAMVNAPGWFAFALTENGVPIGHVAISGTANPHGTGWFHYWLGSQVRGRGLASRAAATVADWALSDDGGALYRLELGHRVENEASGRVAEHAGFVAEGVERGKFLHDGQRKDVRVMARLVTDPWPTYEPIALSRD